MDCKFRKSKLSQEGKRLKGRIGTTATGTHATLGVPPFFDINTPAASHAFSTASFNNLRDKWMRVEEIQDPNAEPDNTLGRYRPRQSKTHNVTFYLMRVLLNFDGGLVVQSTNNENVRSHFTM
eukprot:1090035-Heterocapsa_arctica.AAC.1